ncbi:pyridoxine 5'-phosphate synthase [Leptospira licerasiae]|uniref:Pyridoxine 5'-phosphate synthase n=1 Tax=Leptospira licerasiae str. MMD4847 TaxID=1049971 RepID=A0ABN0H8X1_9LEPT|nr:pyridoxine 5'-phosphate synthase [Leptospira licerasiae]EIE03466.1 pyridoxine 5'-phosphate synthase [Leptospira licerasiae serovar Varillal str. VAR 010]EJZ42213.1 pyridoxine 5'-phosphate synthase [Leptospira licerasiae str. MMD4847]
MVHLSVNVNKIATLRNSRGGNHPDLIHLSKLILDSGAHGITVHPREDERHIKKKDVFDLREFLALYNADKKKKIEYNIEGEPSPRFLDLVLEAKPDQATLVPVTPGEITSDHGFDLKKDSSELKTYIKKIQNAGIRVSIFMETDLENLKLVKDTGADRVEFYTGPYAHAFDHSPEEGKLIFGSFRKAAEFLQTQKIGINAGHDLDHFNLPLFSGLPGLEEVSIGHRLMSYALEIGLEAAVKEYLKALTQR